VEPNFTKQKISASTQVIFENKNKNQLSEDAIRVTCNCVTAIVLKKILENMIPKYYGAGIAQ